MRKSTKIATIGVLAAALMLPAANAVAGTSYAGFSTTLPALQQGVLAANQIKSNAAAAGDIRSISVGSDYSLNARQCRLDRAAGPGSTPAQVTCGTERFNLGDGASATLPSGSHVAAGNRAYLQLHNSTWAVVRVSASGSWRSN
ncbi:MAG: hypothetical protein K0S70_671 [Microbacterium sp.]|nr:hypothetical protein [Microbacterium sp.]